MISYKTLQLNLTTSYSFVEKCLKSYLGKNLNPRNKLFQENNIDTTKTNNQ